MKAFKKLYRENYPEYLERVYASWLGKNIGIRLGAPIEGWTYDEIQKQYPHIEDYLVDYDIFAADDDSNGPLFFVRALDKGNDITAEDIGDTFLNYIQEYTGFFWWGGVGVSTEHTAYENLKRGIKAPRSGSKKVNGIATAEQIGGQIFSDCWGYVSGYDPLLAKELSVKAASVTHDENGLQGAIFVAVAITLAFQRENIMDVLNETLEYLDADMRYAQVCRDIIRFYEENPEDWLKCFRYIQENYGYDKFPGTCHILPNSAIMVMAMCYGENDFSKTLCMLDQCGWDTDCTCGNVGSIMGALVGIEGIDKKWILPINDVVNASSCVGSLNMQSISRSAEMFADYAMQLKGLESPHMSCFRLPYATEGFRSEAGRLEVNHGLLLKKDTEVYHYAYYLPEDIYDARYDPVFSPIVYPNDSIRFYLKSDDLFTVKAFVEDCEGNRYESDETVFLKRGILQYKLPVKKNMVIHRFGLISDEDCTLSGYDVFPVSVSETDFSDYPMDGYGPRWGGDTLYNVRAFTQHSGAWKIEGGKLTGCKDDHALITTGNTAFYANELQMTFEKEGELDDYLVFGFQGYMNFYALGIQRGRLVLLKKTDIYEIVYEKPVETEILSKYTLKAVLSNDKIQVYFCDWMYEIAAEIQRRGGVGVLSKGSLPIHLLGFKFR